MDIVPISAASVNVGNFRYTHVSFYLSPINKIRFSLNRNILVNTNYSTSNLNIKYNN